MKNNLVLILAMMLCSLFIMGCGKDGNGRSSNIVGTWEHSNGSSAYIFNSGGSGCLRHYTIDNYQWKKTSTMLHLTFDGSGSTREGTQSYYYTIEGDMLSLWYEDGDFKGAYIKQ